MSASTGTRKGRERAARNQLRQDFLAPRMQTTSQGKARTPRLLTPQDVAAHTQFSVRQVLRWISSGALAAHKVGRRLRIDERDLALFLMERRLGL